MGKPSYDHETLAAYFRPVSAETEADPIVGPVLARLEDPDLVDAVADVDRSQLHETLARTPQERLRRSFALATTLLRMRRVTG